MRFYSLSALFLSLDALPSSKPKCPPSVQKKQDLKFALLGDWGSGTEGQKKFAQVIDKVTEARQSEFLIALGDNFYEEGVVSVDDPKWDDAWKNVYTGYSSKIPWYPVLGNHDWYSVNPRAQIEKSKLDSQWVLHDFFYTREEQFGDKKAGFVFIDTDLFFYGYDCNGNGCPKVKAAGWTRENNTMESQFQWIETQLKAFSAYDYLFVSGHHYTGICDNRNEMPRLFKLFFGHKHYVGYKKNQETLFVLSGAGGKLDKACGNEDWTRAQDFGFAHVQVNQTGFSVDFIGSDGSAIGSTAGLPRK